MKLRHIVVMLSLVCMAFGQTKIDLSKQKGIVPVANGGTGNAGQTTVSTSPGDIQFGTVKTGTASPTRSLSISNTGTNSITASTEVITGTGAAHFSVAGNCTNEQIDPGATCVEDVTYSPLSAISETALITVTTTAPINQQNPLAVTLAGTGTGAVTFPLTVNCGGLGSGTIQSGETPPLINASCNGGSISGVFTNNYATGTIAALTATAASGSTFNTFAGCGLGATVPGNCTVSAATTVSATFDVTPANVLITILGGGQGTGRSDSDLNDVITGNKIGCTSTAGVLTSGQKCTGTFHQGDVLTLTATPSLTGVGTCVGAACTFTSWAGPTGCGTALTCVITVSGPQTVTMNFAAPTGAAQIALVQPINGGTQGTNNVTGNFSLAQSAGDTNIIYVEWDNNTATVSSVTDTKGNTYTQAPSCSPKVSSGSSIALYYAKNIVAAAAGSNTVTVALSASPAYRAILGAEYSGLDTTAPFDACNGGTGSGTAMSSGSFTSTVANGLVTGGDISADHITANSTNFTQQILFKGNDMEDRQNVAAAAYTFAPTQNVSGIWAAIGAAWKNGGGGGGSTNLSFNVVCGGSGSGTVSASGSSLSCAGGVPVSGGISLSVAPNSTPTILAAPLSGSVFSTYSGGGGCGTNPSCTTNPITLNTTITASFTLAGVQNYYVNTSTGSNSNSGLCAVAGTPSGCTGPWLTIGKAASTNLTLGASGTVVNVAAGTYSECLATTQSGTSTQRLRYQSTSLYGAKVICNGAVTPAGAHTVWANGTGANTRTADYVDIVGFEITATTPSNMCEGISSFGAFALIQRNYVHDILGLNAGICNTQGGAGIVLRNNGNPSTVAHDSIVDGNIIDNIGTGDDGVVGDVCTTQHGVYIASPRHTVTNNIISRACGWGIHMFHDTYQDVIANNTVIHNYRGGIIVSASDGFTNDYTSVINNVVANNGGGEYGIEERWGPTGSHNVYRNNRMWGNLPTSGCTNPATGFSLCEYNFANGARTVSGPTGVGTNAQFTSYTGNAKTGNYAPAGSNLLVNTGVNGPCAGSPGFTTCVPAKAIDGTTARPQGAGFDQGAYEQ